MSTPAPLTQTEAQNATLALAAAQTAYAMNNGGGLTVGEPLRYIDDQTTNLQALRESVGGGK